MAAPGATVTEDASASEGPDLGAGEPRPPTRAAAAPTMPPWQRLYVIAILAITVGAIAYTLCDWSQWTRLQLNPYDGRWWWQAGPTQSVPINYYGTILWGLGGAAVGAALGLAVTTMWRRPLPPTWLTLGAAWSLTATLFAGTYYFWNLWPI